MHFVSVIVIQSVWCQWNHTQNVCTVTYTIAYERLHWGMMGVFAVWKRRFDWWTYGLILFVPDIDTPVTRGTSSSFWYKLQFLYMIKMQLFKTAASCLVFSRGEITITGAIWSSAACARLTGQERKKRLKKICGHTKNTKHMYLRHHCSFTLAG